MRRHRRHTVRSVELNLAAMLDMAFQLLAFFVLTYRPAAVEGEIDLRLPPTAAIAPAPTTVEPGRRIDPLAGLTTLEVELQAAAGGDLGRILLAGHSVDGLGRLERKLAHTLADPLMPFQRVALRVGPQLRYEVLMQVIDICGRQRLPSGRRLEELSLQEMAE